MGRNVSVERGVALLDEKLPGWENDIDLDELDLGSGCRCVVGQLHGGLRGRWPENAYWRGLKALGVPESIRMEERYGFVWRGTGSWAGLTEAWCRVILRRRNT